MDTYVQFVDAFLALTGIDLQYYKRPQMERRLTALRERHGVSDFPTFIAKLQSNPALLTEVVDKITINVSEFFRNADRWAALQESIAQMDVNRCTEIWSAACSTGEEPYTVAMIMKHKLRKPFHVLATDVDEKALKRAEDGRYPTYQVRSVPDAYRQCFEIDKETWVVRPEFRSEVSFVTHNLLADPYPKGLDVIICRNVLIYFTEAGKQRVVSQFAESLRPGGLLFVGSTEQFLHADRYGLQQTAPFMYRRSE